MDNAGTFSTDVVAFDALIMWGRKRVLNVPNRRSAVMPRLSNVRIAGRLAIAIAIPLAIFTCLAAYDLFLTWRVRSEMANLSQMSQAVAGISRLVHNLQRERGTSAVFVSSKGTQWRNEMPAVRKLTDEQRTIADKFLSELGEMTISGEFKSAVVKSIAAVGQLDGKRKEIDDLSASPQASIAYFTETIAKLLVVAGEVAKVSSQGETSVAISAYVNFMQGKERAGQERAVAAASISLGKFDLPGYVRVLSLRAAQETYFNAFSDTATPAQTDFFQKVMSAPVVATVAKMRETIATDGMSGNMRGIDGKSWFEAATARIDLL